MIDKDTLRIWLRRWEEIRATHYQRLVASYTPEQVEIVHEMQKAARQVQTCRARLAKPHPIGPDRNLAWPQEPPKKEVPMIIKTQNAKLQKILAGVAMRHPDVSTAFDVSTMQPSALGNLVTVLHREYTGEWALHFRDFAPGEIRNFKELLEVDAKALLLSVGQFGADTEDFIFWLEQIYGQTVTKKQATKVMQLFRLWYAYSYPGEYQEPASAKPGPFAALALKDTKAAQNERKKKQYNRRKEVFAKKNWHSDTAILNYLADNPELIPENPNK